MTIPPTSATPAVSSEPVGTPREGLGWLLEDFRTQVPDIQGAFLLSRDGLVLAAAGLTVDEADGAAAVAAALYSAAAAAGKITSSLGGAVQQIIVEHDAGYMILMNTPDQHPDASAHEPGPDRAGPRWSGACWACWPGPTHGPGWSRTGWPC